MSEIFILDATALISGLDPNIINRTLWTVAEVIDEIKDSRNKFRIEMAIENKMIKIGSPSATMINKIKQAAEKSGDIVVLSDTDIKILALAYELKDKGHEVVILTDDYSVQNVASQLKIESKAYTTAGIRYEIKWELYCPSCFHSIEMRYTKRKQIFCEICGTKMKRRPYDKQKFKERKK
ncbi:MAG: NOB1 family endonuclease [Promethearchaeota archaeon]